MKTRGIEVIKPIVRSQNFDCSRKYGGPLITENDLQFNKISLRLVNF